MTNTSKGHDYEREVKNIFVDNGYDVVRAAASKSPFDLVATKITQRDIKTTYIIVLMQQKINKKRKKVKK